MKKSLFIILLLASFVGHAQEEAPPGRHQAHVALAQYPARIGIPGFSPIHPGFLFGLSKSWNKHPKHRFFQAANLGYFFHKDVQHAVQLFTEAGYQLKFSNGLAVSPFVLGGGYVMSVLDMKSVIWNASTQEYEIDKFPLRHNWMIALGASLSYETNLMIIPNRKTSVFLDYRLQVQGVFVKKTVPAVAYTPLRLGLSIPL